MKRNNQYDYDDGRTIVDMDVDGMRWHDRSIRLEKFTSPTQPNSTGQMTRSEARQYTWYSLLSASLIVGVFSATWILFTLFCLHIWFK
jgi:hypothetical protein